MTKSEERPHEPRRGPNRIAIRAAQKIMNGVRQKQIACRQRDSGIDRLQTMSKTSATLGAYTSASFVPLGLDGEFRALS
jgi:hypothetical protein